MREPVILHMAGGGVVLQAIFSLVDAFGWHHFTVPQQSALTGLLTALYAFYVRSQVAPWPSADSAVKATPKG